jgi:hypothetical protein
VNPRFTFQKLDSQPKDSLERIDSRKSTDSGYRKVKSGRTPDFTASQRYLPALPFVMRSNRFLSFPSPPCRTTHRPGPAAPGVRCPPPLVRVRPRLPRPRPPRRPAAAATDDTFGLGREADREERARDRPGVVGEEEVEGAGREEQVVRVPAANERGELDEVHPSDFPHARGAERVDSVAGASGDAEDAGVGTEEAQTTERGQG